MAHRVLLSRSSAALRHSFGPFFLGSCRFTTCLRSFFLCCPPLGCGSLWSLFLFWCRHTEFSLVDDVSRSSPLFPPPLSCIFITCFSVCPLLASCFGNVTEVICMDLHRHGHVDRFFFFVALDFLLCIRRPTWGIRPPIWALWFLPRSRYRARKFSSAFDLVSRFRRR